MVTIIHELTLLQEREGWLSEDALRQLAERLKVPLHRVESVSTFYTHFRRTLQTPYDQPSMSPPVLLRRTRDFPGQISSPTVMKSRSVTVSS